MKFSLESNVGFSVRAYAEGNITINVPAQTYDEHLEGATQRSTEEVVTQSLIITPHEIIKGWPPQHFEDLQMAHFEPIVALKPEVLIFGTGRQLRMPEVGITTHLIQQGIGLETMDTAAACRTYNILMAEGRRVAAALFMIEAGDQK